MSNPPGISLVIKLIICFQYGTIFSYVAELFPTHIRGFALGTSVLVGRIMSSLSSYMIFFTDSYNLHPLATTLITSTIALPLSMYLRETKDQSISN
jgi:hypothetical protein